MYRYEFTPLANERLDKMARRNPQQAKAILRKIMWLAEHADEIAHQPIKGSPYFSDRQQLIRVFFSFITILAHSDCDNITEM
jgi:mRNA-degrading endonuclease RelE of RelBE toxin-antitoxin system